MPRKPEVHQPGIGSLADAVFNENTRKKIVKGPKEIVRDAEFRKFLKDTSTSNNERQEPSLDTEEE